MSDNYMTIEERLDIIDQALQDYRANKLSPFSTFTAITLIIYPGEISDDLKRWAINSINNATRNKVSGGE